jgi:hypothetical protein
MTTGNPADTNTVLDASEFIKNIFTIKLSPGGGADLNGDFNRYLDIFQYTTLNDDPSVPGSTPTTQALTKEMQQIFADINNPQNGALPEYFTRGKCRDTSIGGNDAINCYPQFNETDDVSSHPFLETMPGDPLSGMGRVYSEMYDDQQQIMYITFGVPKYNSLTNFYSKAVTAEIAELMNNGASATTIGGLVGATLTSLIKLPALPMVFIMNALGRITEQPITKYYDFKSAMPLYYRCVNSMIIHLTVNLGLANDEYLSPTSAQVGGGNIQNLTPQEQAIEAQSNGGHNAGLPEIFRLWGFDIYRILTKKYKYIKGGSSSSNYVIPQSSDDYLNNVGSTITPSIDVNTENYAGDFITTLEANLYDASLYVGFRIEKGVDTSESFSNETGESSVAQEVNQKAQQARDARFAVADGNLGSGVLSKIGAFLSGVAKSTVTTIAGDTVETVLAGSGNIDFPDVWKTSSFSKSYHFNMSLRSPYGDPYSILQNLYIPLTLLLGGALPRAIGRAAYTAPFVCRAYCKGMFAVPLGMISSISIKRGADQFGWTTARLPTCIDVSFEIKDLSPAMYMAMGSGDSTGNLFSECEAIFGANSTFQEYLMTLSGMGLADRISWIRNLRRKATILLAQGMSTKMSPFYLGSQLGNTLPARILSRFVPATRMVLSNKN